jgi:hypothetical protein
MPFILNSFRSMYFAAARKQNNEFSAIKYNPLGIVGACMIAFDSGIVVFSSPAER